MPEEFSYRRTVPAAVTEIRLPTSKSICNRALMLSAWSGGLIKPREISEAADSRLLSRLLDEGNAAEFNAQDAGTAFRFLAAWLGLSGKNCLLTGSARMKERPVAELVDALRLLGCQVDYEEKVGFPPLRFRGFQHSGMHELKMGLKTSSQFISALMMAAPVLPQGLRIQLEKGGGSFPYLELTANVMRDCGLKVQISRNEIVIPAQPFKEKILDIEADWSSAAAFYGILALMPAGHGYYFPGLNSRSLQGDRVLAEIPVFRHILTENYEQGICIRRIPGQEMPKEVSVDFRDCPDLALAIITTCAAAGIAGNFSGLSSLQIKESRRLEALAAELSKLGVMLEVSGDSSEACLKAAPLVWPEKIPEFDCHNDHRIAMALSILLFTAPGRKAVFLQPDVVGKSFPHFWEELRKAGFSTQA